MPICERVWHGNCNDDADDDDAADDSHDATADNDDDGMTCNKHKNIKGNVFVDIKENVECDNRMKTNQIEFNFLTYLITLFPIFPNQRSSMDMLKDE